MNLSQQNVAFKINVMLTLTQGKQVLYKTRNYFNSLTIK
jgi:hypothetical protein